MKKLRILIISTFFPPLNSIASLRPYSWAKYWHEAGHDVTVLTTQKLACASNLKLTNPGYNVIEVPINSKVSSLKQSYLVKKQPLHFRLLDWIRSRTGILSACRMPDYTQMWVKPALKAITTHQPWDLVISSSGPFPVHLVAEQLKKKGMTQKWIADFRDLWTDNHIYKGLFPFTLIEKYIEKRIARRADILTTVSPPLAKTLSDKYGASKTFTVENGFDPDQFTKLPEESIFPNDGKVRLVYTGTVYPNKQNPEPLFEALRELNDDKIEVIFAGARQSHLQILIEKYNVEKWVKLKGLIDLESALRMQKDAHFLLCLPWTDLTVDGLYGGKLFEYFNSGSPILAIGGTGIEAAQQLILNAKAGYILSSPNEIKVFLKDRINLSKRVRTSIDPQFLNRYNRKHLASQLLEILT